MCPRHIYNRMDATGAAPVVNMAPHARCLPARGRADRSRRAVGPDTGGLVGVLCHAALQDREHKASHATLHTTQVLCLLACPAECSQNLASLVSMAEELLPRRPCAPCTIGIAGRAVCAQRLGNIGGPVLVLHTRALSCARAGARRERQRPGRTLAPRDRCTQRLSYTSLGSMSSSIDHTGIGHPTQY